MNLSIFFYLYLITFRNNNNELLFFANVAGAKLKYQAKMLICVIAELSSLIKIIHLF